MLLASGQFMPVVSVRLYDEAEQDPIITDHGSSWLDLLPRACEFGTFETAASGRTKLEWIEDIGIINRLTLTLKDTNSTHFSFTGTGSWRSLRPSTSAPRALRLVQLDTTPGITAAAQSNYTIPAAVDFAVSASLPDTPTDWDPVTYPPNVQIEFAQQWAIGLTKTDTALLRLVGGVYVPVMSIPPPPRGAGYSDLEEMFFYVRNARGRIGISSDFGESWEWYQSPIGEDLTLGSGKITFRVQGGMAVFGLHQLSAVTGYYQSQERDVYTERLAVAPTITGRYALQAGTSVSFSDQSTSNRRLACYRATLTPTTVAGTPFTFYRCPSLQSVWMRWPVDETAGAGTYTTPWDERIKSISIQKPRELSQGRATITVEIDRGGEWPGAVGSLRDRKLQIRAGYRRGGTDNLWVLFTGYITDWKTQGEGGRFQAELTCENATQTFRSTRWTSEDIAALGDQSLNDALDYILASEGLNASYRDWHALGDLLALPAGLAEDPFELIRQNETKWETLERLVGYAAYPGLQIAALDDATFVTVPMDTTSGTSHTYEALPEEGDLWTIAQQLSNRVDYQQSVTAILVTGRSEWGSKLAAYAVDAYAEGSVLSGRFAPRRHVIEEEISGTCTPGIVVARCQSLAFKHFPVRGEPDLVVALNPTVGRLDEIVVNGGAISGVADGTAYVCLELRHEIRCNDDGSAEMVTAGGLWELQ